MVNECTCFISILISDAGKSSGISSIEELENFAMGRGQKNVNEELKVHSSGEGVKTSDSRAKNYGADDVESFFSKSSRSNSVPKTRATASVSTITLKDTTNFVILWSINICFLTPLLRTL